MRLREVKKGMNVEVYRMLFRDIVVRKVTGKKGEIVHIRHIDDPSDIDTVMVKFKGIKELQYLSHKELKEVK